MNKASISKTRSKAPLIIIGVILLSILAGVLLYMAVLKPKTTADVTVTKNNENNTAAIEAEKANPTVVITPETKPAVTNTSDTETPSGAGTTGASGSPATIDEYGPSTDLNRSNIHGAVVAVQALYNDFISKMFGIPISSRQSVADQFITDNSALFSPDYNYLGSNSIHLLPQGTNIDIPSGMTAHSAIIDANDPSQTIVQMYFDHDTSWSILLIVKMKDSTNISNVQKLMFRMSQNPL